MKELIYKDDARRAVLKANPSVAFCIDNIKAVDAKAVVRDKIIELCGDLPRIELFARQHADGWDCWGNETDKFSQEVG